VYYFNGFSLENEDILFDEYSNKNEFSVLGFSYGAIKAFEYVYNSKDRVDLLQLFSPANFMNKDEKFKKLQLISYRKNRELYTKTFLKNCAYPSKINLSSYSKDSNVNELKELLYYNWDREKLQKIIDRGVKIEVYLGEYDKIIDSNFNYEFFKEFATLYFIKNVGHILQS